MKVIKNYLYNAGYQILALILPLVTAPYVSRVLTQKGVGLNAFTNSIVQYFILFGSIGIALYGNREIAYVKRDRKKMSYVFWEIQILKTVGIVVSLLLYVIFLYFYQVHLNLMIFQALNLIAAAFDISWFFMGLEDFKRTVIRNTLVKILSLVFIFVFVKNSGDLTIYISILALSTLLGNLTLWPPLKKILVKVDFKRLRIIRHFRPTVALFIPQIATQIYLVLNKTMLGIMTGTDNAGFYNYSDNLVKVVLALITASGTVMLPHVANAFSLGQHEKVNKYLYTSFDFVSLIAVPATFGLAAVSLHLGPYFYGRGYGPVGLAMMIESPVLLLIGWSNVVGQQYLLPTGQNRPFTVSVVLGAISNIIANVPFIYLWGLNGAMFATVFSEFIVTAYQLWYIRSSIEFKRLFSNLPKYFLAGIIMFVPVFKLNVSLHTSVLTIAVEVLLGIIIYAILILLLKPTSLNSVLTILKKNRK
jgi:O-antigen/teichoic acid export membrane protein